MEGMKGIGSVITEDVVETLRLGLRLGFVGANGGSGCCVGLSLSSWITPGWNGALQSSLDSMKTT